ncbi:MAG: Uma2 family endonuclease [Myxococcales bacterium]|nr:Uma2 family endonuclease [Myxococcales bacterium]
MVQPSTREATYADLEALPAHVTGQIVDGTLYAHARPASPHARASSVLGGDLGGPFDRGRGGPGGWLLLFEPELHLGRDVLVPDHAGWRRTRMPEMPRVPYFELAPDWVCEVLWPSTAGLDRVKKLAVYLREGVGHLWLVDPDGRTLEVLRREGERFVVAATFEGDAPVRAEPFDAVELELGALWRG